MFIQIVLRVLIIKPLNTIEICTMHNRPPRMSSKPYNIKRGPFVYLPFIFLKLVCSLYMARDDGKKWSMGEFELV